MAEKAKDSLPGGDGYLGEFRRGPAIFTVHQIAIAPKRYRVQCDDGNGPSEVCTFTDRPGSGPTWHGPWNGDEWAAWIEINAREVVRSPERLETRVWRWGMPLFLHSAAAPDRTPRRR